jgi:nitroimidazol reductase NimA-like FMN-containing flavoprotein (pyridoxamine 5'-phosphate oxidase superfamily)
LAGLGKRERDYLRNHELCHMATASAKAKPHVVPVIYALDGDNIIIAVDYGTKKLKNLKENKMVAIVVDEYGSKRNSGLMVEGSCEIYERGTEYLRLLKILFDRFDFYKRNPWGEGESPILRVRPVKAILW